MFLKDTKREALLNLMLENGRLHWLCQILQAIKSQPEELAWFSEWIWVKAKTAMEELTEICKN